MVRSKISPQVMYDLFKARERPQVKKTDQLKRQMYRNRREIMNHALDPLEFHSFFVGNKFLPNMSYKETGDN
jgi:hypothetical protein